MKTILATTDYSHTATNAVEYAAALAGFVQARLLLFNAFHLAIPATPAPLVLPDIDELITENQQRLQLLGDRLAERYSITVSCHTGVTFLLEELNKLVEREGVDLVVMGMRGESLTRKLFGSITSAVLQQGRYPLLVVPDEARHQGILRILFAIKANYLSPQHSLGLLPDIAKAYGAEVKILHVETPGEREHAENLVKAGGTNMEKLLRGIKHSYAFIEDEDVLSGLERGIQENSADLLVMVPHKPNFWDGLLNRSHTRNMALHTHVPLLALPNVLRKQGHNSSASGAQEVKL
jgi:nucleotide-binding universal stress UspA family protein